MGPVDEEARFAAQREQMVKDQLVDRGIGDRRVIEVMREVPRHHFVPQAERDRAYEDRPLPIPNEQTISQPYIVAYMLQALALQGVERVLDIGTGSGYQAALLGELAREVHTVERHTELAASASRKLADLGYTNVHVHHGDGSNGWPPAAPYDAIIVAAGAPLVPQPLLDQLSGQGRLVIPVGESGRQVLQLWKPGGSGYDYEELVPVAFVPLVGEHGWGQLR
jgi:protein-L-isoaspartate(D-aspartate) O-methyltransferase